jgi:hypothetical protein
LIMFDVVLYLCFVPSNQIDFLGWKLLFVLQISKRSLNELIYNFLDMVFVGFWMPFGQAKNDRIHNLKDWFLVDSPENDFFNEFIIDDDFQNLETAIKIPERGTCVWRATKHLLTEWGRGNPHAPPLRIQKYSCN